MESFRVLLSNKILLDHKDIPYFVLANLETFTFWTFFLPHNWQGVGPDPRSGPRFSTRDSSMGLGHRRQGDSVFLTPSPGPKGSYEAEYLFPYPTNHTLLKNQTIIFDWKMIEKKRSKKILPNLPKNIKKNIFWIFKFWHFWDLDPTFWNFENVHIFRPSIHSSS